MAGIFFLIDQLAVGLYIVLGALALWHAWRFMSARAELRATFYELERDIARQRQWDALLWVAVMGQLALGVWGVQREVVPFLQSEINVQEAVAMGLVAQDGAAATFTPAPIAGGLDIQPVPPLGANDIILLVTPTLTPTPVGTIVPNAPAVIGCNDERATLQVPANGMRVFSPIPIVGTAFTESFAVAKLEIKGPSTNDSYIVIDDKRQPITTTSAFSQFSPALYTPGAYQLRVMVFDLTDTAVASCMVTIYITDPPITPTPTRTPSV